MSKTVNLKKTMRYLFPVALVVAMISLTLSLNDSRDPYVPFQNVSMDKKTAGEYQFQENRKNEETIQFLHYPRFEQETMNQNVLHYIDQLTFEKGVFLLDYESQNVLQDYTTLTFFEKQYDQELQHIRTKKHHMTMRNQDGHIMKTSDVFRRDYRHMLKQKIKQETNKEVEINDALAIALYDTHVDVQVEETTVPIAYDTIPNYLRIPQKSIAKQHLQKKRVPTYDPNKKMVAFTFDDGPSPYTMKIMKEFEKYDGTATFFMLGKNIEKHSDTLQYMYEQGFEIANHSWDHQSIKSDDADFIRQEIFDTQDLIYRICGDEPTKVRPPYGEFNALSEEVAEDLELTLWTVDTLDWKSRDKNSVKAAILRDIQDGSIILLHDLYESSYEAIVEILPQLAKQGYQFVNVSDILKERYS